jgi:hypothetical protein
MNEDIQKGEQVKPRVATEGQTAQQVRPNPSITLNLQFSGRDIPLVESDLTSSNQRTEILLVVTLFAFLHNCKKSAYRKWNLAHDRN